MKKISQKEIVQAIITEALTIKRKKQLFEEAKKINSELKQLNEYGHPGVMAGFGFKDYQGPSPVLGLVTPSNYEEQKPEGEDCGCKLDQFPKLEKDIDSFGTEDGVVGDDTAAVNDVQAIKDEIEDIKAKLTQLGDSLGSL